MCVLPFIPIAAAPPFVPLLSLQEVLFIASLVCIGLVMRAMHHRGATCFEWCWHVLRRVLSHMFVTCVYYHTHVLLQPVHYIYSVSALLFFCRALLQWLITVMGRHTRQCQISACWQFKPVTKLPSQPIGADKMANLTLWWDVMVSRIAPVIS